MNFILLQVQDTLATSGGAQSLSLFELLLKGGWFMIPLLILSLLAVYFFVDRWIAIRNASKVDNSLISDIEDYMKGGNLPAAIALCKERDNPISRMLEKGLKRIGKPIKNIEVSMENVGKLELQKVEGRIGYLATIAGAAPMIGFLGTVTGMIRVFFNISNAGNNVDPGLLAGGIYEALLTTATGLIIGIIAYIGYNYLVSKVSKLVYKMEAATVEFVDLLQEPV